MKLLSVALLGLLLLDAPLHAADAPAPASTVSHNDALRAELEAMLVTDQAQRNQMAAVEKEQGRNSPEIAALWKEQAASDARNIKRLDEIIAEIGWPKRSVLGDKAASAAFLILQHAEPVYQKKYVPLARAAVAAGEMRGASLALLEDRILIRDGKSQIYGSQVTRNADGDWEALPIEDEAHVDERRASVGLGPLAPYLQGFADRGGGKVSSRGQPPPSAATPTQPAPIPAAAPTPAR